MDIKKLAQENFALLVKHRRHLHENPELSSVEEETVAYICEQLSSLGIEHVNIPRGGVLAYIGKGKPGKKVLLRADIDALPITETPNNLKNPRVCISKNAGVMHACGHDAHTSMLLVTAKILNEHSDELSGEVMLVFERGEEGGGNIRYILEYFDREGVKYDSCFGMHVEQKLQTGKFGISAGYADAGSIPINFRITGQGGHGSRPDLSNNPIDCMLAMIGEIYDIRMKHISPFEQLTLTICQINAGTKSNIIPESVEFVGSARYFSQELVKVPFLRELNKIAATIGERYNCKVENLGRGGAKPIINNESASVLAQKAIIKTLGQDALRPQMPTMGSESFALFTMFAPGCYGNLGIKNNTVGSGAEIHNQYFDIDEEAMIYGVCAHVGYALEFLNSEEKIEFTPKYSSAAELYA